MYKENEMIGFWKEKNILLDSFFTEL